MGRSDDEVAMGVVRGGKVPGMAGADALDQGRRSFAGQAWADAYAQLSAADRHAPLEPEDLERLATAAYLVGRDDDGADIGRVPIRSS